MNTKEMIEVMQAYAEGKTIEAKHAGIVTTTVCTKDWSECPKPVWDWLNVQYRIAPEPKKEGRWERKNIRIFYGEYAFIWEDPDSGDELIHLSRMISTPGFGGIDYQSPFNPKVIVRSMVPVMFNTKSCYSVSSFDENYRPGIPVAAWFWREGEQ